MKNKFKKSKIIVPALALITATTAASVTGTVAWFTASRAVTVTTYAFVSTKLESNLEVSLTAGNGTTVDTTNTQKINIDGKLTHGSYAAVKGSTGHLWTAVLNDEATDPTTFTDLKDIDGGKATTTDNVTTSTWLARQDAGGKIWYGVSWTMEFKLTSATSNQTDYLLFDSKGSTFTDSKSDETGTKTAPGLRVALMTADKVLVVGGDTEMTHVKDSSSTVSFGTNDYIQVATGNDKLGDNATNLATDNMNFGVISNTSALTITCVAWYEGTDTNVVSRYVSNSTTTPATYADTIMSEVTSSLSFYTRYVTTKSN